MPGSQPTSKVAHQERDNVLCFWLPGTRCAFGGLVLPAHSGHWTETLGTCPQPRGNSSIARSIPAVRRSPRRSRPGPCTPWVGPECGLTPGRGPGCWHPLLAQLLLVPPMTSPTRRWCSRAHPSPPRRAAPSPRRGPPHARPSRRRGGRRPATTKVTGTRPPGVRRAPGAFAPRPAPCARDAGPLAPCPEARRVRSRAGPVPPLRPGDRGGWSRRAVGRGTADRSGEARARLRDDRDRAAALQHRILDLLQALHPPQLPRALQDVVLTDARLAPVATGRPGCRGTAGAKMGIVGPPPGGGVDPAAIIPPSGKARVHSVRG